MAAFASFAFLKRDNSLQLKSVELFSTKKSQSGKDRLVPSHPKKRRKKKKFLQVMMSLDAVKAVVMGTVFVMVYCVLKDRKFKQFHTTQSELMNVCMNDWTITHFMMLSYMMPPFIVTRKLIIKISISYNTAKALTEGRIIVEALICSSIA